MFQRGDPSALAWLIGNELRQARLRAGETQAAAAKVLACSAPRINYLEIGRTQQRLDELETLLKFYGAGADDIERLVTLASRPVERTWWTPWSAVIPDWMRTFVGLEGLATAEFAYHPLVIPGLLQTRDYVAALAVGSPFLRPDHYNRVVEFRLARQARLAEEYQPLHLTAVITESALLRRVGGVDVMHGQLEHLIALSRRSNVTLHVMPDSVAMHDGLEGPFMIVHLTGVQPIAYVEIPDDAVYVRDHDDVAGYLARADRLCSTALPKAESVDLIASRLAEMN